MVFSNLEILNEFDHISNAEKLFYENVLQLQSILQKKLIPKDLNTPNLVFVGNY